MLLSSIVSPILISRGAELAILDRLRAMAGAGQGTVAVITGEAGVGKSRLVAELTSRASAEGFRVQKGRCYEPDLRLPYAPVLDLLRVHLIGGPDSLPAGLFETVPDLLELLPELKVHLPGTAPVRTVDAEQHKRRLFEVLLRLITLPLDSDSPKTATPLLIIFEDLHWSDDTSQPQVWAHH